MRSVPPSSTPLCERWHRRHRSCISRSTGGRSPDRQPRSIPGRMAPDPGGRPHAARRCASDRHAEALSDRCLCSRSSGAGSATTEPGARCRDGRATIRCLTRTMAAPAWPSMWPWSARRRPRTSSVRPAPGPRTIPGRHRDPKRQAVDVRSCDPGPKAAGPPTITPSAFDVLAGPSRDHRRRHDERSGRLRHGHMRRRQGPDRCRALSLR